LGLTGNEEFTQCKHLKKDDNSASFPFATKPVFTKDGYEICNAFPGRVLPESKRYVNPKMENELKIFKKKIAARYANRQIIEWSFPRLKELEERPHYSTAIVSLTKLALSQSSQEDKKS